MIDLGDYGHPPSKRGRAYPLVLLQLIHRMRLELLLLLTIAVLINRTWFLAAGQPTAMW